MPTQRRHRDVPLTRIKTERWTSEEPGVPDCAAGSDRQPALLALHPHLRVAALASSDHPSGGESLQIWRKAAYDYFARS